MTPDAASTPGIARKRSTRSRCARRIWAIDGNRCGDSETSAVSTRSALKPRSCERSDAKLAMSSPAPTSRTSASAISAATSPSRRRRCSRLVPARASSRTAEPSVTSLVCRSGASAHNKPQPSDNAVATASARPSSAIPSARGSSAPAMRTNDSSATHAIPTPRTPPAAASGSTSPINWRASRPREAPSMIRVAISRRRSTLRESSRFATLAHAMSNTATTAQSRRRSAWRVVPSISPTSGRTTA